MTYASIEKMMGGRDSLIARNKEKDLVFVEHREQTPEVDEHYMLMTLQKNGWARVNCYYPDGTIDETFER